QTRGRIPEVLKPGDVTSATRLALVNAIYLKAPWLRPFQADQTTDEPFTKLDGSTVEVPTMHTTHGSCGTGAGWGAFELRYIGNTVSMLVVVPDDLAAFEASLDEAALAEVSRVVRQGFASPDLTMPRFGFETREELSAVLAELGMPDAFDPDVADFSGMTGARELFIGRVIHQANISVDEKGTEAAAVTVVGMDVTGGPSDICTVHADRPFIFAVRDVETGAILFMGRVVDPSAT
ncbi:MAG TPA: serpin family protein, partial [Candidatus Limnocylindrales bacterium]|nr:serpin family protein [Candidatus Limnocylindrales bacterium]